MEEEVLPFHYGQFVSTNPEFKIPYSWPVRTYGEMRGYICEVNDRGGEFIYALALVNSKGEYIGKQAWFEHDALILEREVSQNALKFLKANAHDNW